MTGTSSAVHCCAHFQRSPLNTTCPFYRLTAQQLPWSFTAQSVCIRRQYLASLQFYSLFIAASFHLKALGDCLLWLQKYSTINVSTGTCHLTKKTEQPEAWNSFCVMKYYKF
jgi:hypothetical protein